MFYVLFLIHFFCSFFTVNSTILYDVPYGGSLTLSLHSNGTKLNNPFLNLTPQCTRVKFSGLSRISHPNKMFHVLRIHAMPVTSTKENKYKICYPSNASSFVGDCEDFKWEELTFIDKGGEGGGGGEGGRGRWSSFQSPFSSSHADICTSTSNKQEIKLFSNDEFRLYRLLFLITGILSLFFSQKLSSSIHFYYTLCSLFGILFIFYFVIVKMKNVLFKRNRGYFSFIFYGLSSFFSIYLVNLFFQFIKSLMKNWGIEEYEMYMVAAIVSLLILFFGSASGIAFVNKFLVKKNKKMDSDFQKLVCWIINLFAFLCFSQCSQDLLFCILSFSSATILFFFKTIFLEWFRVGKKKENRKKSREEESVSYPEMRQSQIMSEPYPSFVHGVGTLNRRYKEVDTTRVTSLATGLALREMVRSPEFQAWAKSRGASIGLPREPRPEARSDDEIAATAYISLSIFSNFRHFVNISSMAAVLVGHWCSSLLPFSSRVHEARACFEIKPKKIAVWKMVRFVTTFL